MDKLRLLKINRIWTFPLACFLMEGLSTDAIARPIAANSSSTHHSLSFNTEFDLLEAPTAQVASVAQLSDVKSTDWAFEALQSLVERYGCIIGYPNQTYRGDRALSRFEFAAGLNACLNRLQELLQAGLAETTTRDDFVKLKQLQEQFAAELSALRGSVESLEVRTNTLESQQFSTTTKLGGVTIVGVQTRSENRADLNPRDGRRDTQDLTSNTNLVYLNQLYLTTQFTPRSYLLTGLLTGNAVLGDRLTNDGSLGLEYPTNGSPILSDLSFRWLPADNLAVLVGTVGVDMLRAFRGPNLVESAATGPLSVFAQRNPILNTGFSGAGAAFDWQFARWGSLQAIYTNNNAASPQQGRGLFNGEHTLGAQLLITPADPLDISVYYVNNYSPDGLFQTFAGDTRLTPINSLTGTASPLTTNAVGATVTWRFSPKVTLGGWAGYASSSIPGRSGNVETTNYMLFLNFSDLLTKGNLGGIYVGQPPKIISSDLPIGRNIPDFLDTRLGRSGGQPGTTVHIEVFYRIQINDYISITPGIIHIREPGHTPNSDPFTIGILRTTFAF